MIVILQYFTRSFIRSGEHTSEHYGITSESNCFAHCAWSRNAAISNDLNIFTVVFFSSKSSEYCINLTYANAGPATAFNIVIEDPLPAGLINPLVQTSDPAVTLRPGSSFIWDLERLEPMAGGTITITAQVGEGFVGTLTNTATISTTVPESDTSNNTSASIFTRVLANAVYLPLVRR